MPTMPPKLLLYLVQSNKVIIGRIPFWQRSKILKSPPSCSYDLYLILWMTTCLTAYITLFIFQGTLPIPSLINKLGRSKFSLRTTNYLTKYAFQNLLSHIIFSSLPTSTYYLYFPSTHSINNTEHFSYFLRVIISATSSVPKFQEERQFFEHGKSLININIRKIPSLQQNAFLIWLLHKKELKKKIQESTQTWNKLPNEQHEITFLQAMMNPQNWFPESLHKFSHTYTKSDCAKVRRTLFSNTNG